MKLNNEQFYNRDLSWLRFNHRVLQEAGDIRNPLYESLEFSSKRKGKHSGYNKYVI